MTYRQMVSIYVGEHLFAYLNLNGNVPIIGPYKTYHGSFAYYVEVNYRLHRKRSKTSILE